MLIPLLDTRAAAVLLAATALSLLSPPDARSQSATGCSGPRILGPSNEDEVHWSLSGDLVAADRRQREIVAEAFGMAPPLLCEAVRRVAFFDDPERRGTSGLNKSNDRQDLLYLNVASPMFRESVLAVSQNARLEAIQTILHESAHAAGRLLYTQSAEGPPAWLQWRPDAELWPAGTRAAAREVIEGMRLDRGLFQEWSRIHDTFRRRGWASAYYGDGWSARRGADHPASGFMSAYGGENVTEDIAEMTGWALVSSRAGEGSAQDHACRAMRSEPGPAIPSRLATVFTKVGFLESAGFITERTYDDCVRNLKIRGRGSGFFTFEGTKQVNRYASNVRGRIGRLDGTGPWVFELEAEGTVGIEDEGTRPARAVLRLVLAPPGEDLANVSFPRGAYRIGPGGHPENSMRIHYDSEGREKLGIEITEGHVLVARASHDLVEGSVFIQKYINHTELLKVPVPPDPPRVLTFRKEN